MAEELIDKVVAFKNSKLKHAGPCVTKDIKLLGGDGFYSLLHVELVQKYQVSDAVAKHLAHAYGAAAFAVCELATPVKRTASTMGTITDAGHHRGRLIVPDYPFIEAEIKYACKHEMALTVKDMLTTRMRLAYLNSEAAKQAIPKVADLMQKELGWTKKEKEEQIRVAREYIGAFGGPIADKSKATLQMATFTDLHEVFSEIDTTSSGYLNAAQFDKAAMKLGFPFKNDAELAAKFKDVDTSGNGKVSEAEFIEWWNGRNSEKVMRQLQKSLTLTAASDAAVDRSNAQHK